MVELTDSTGCGDEIAVEVPQEHTQHRMQPQVAGSCASAGSHRPLSVPRTAVAIRLPKLWLAQCRCGARLGEVELWRRNRGKVP